MKKICILGGGSKSWCIEMVMSFLDSNLEPGNIVLYDIMALRAEQNARLFHKYICKRDLQWLVSIDENLQSAISNSDIVIISIVPDSYHRIKNDFKICAEYGVKHISGDTVGPAGFMRSIKCISIFTEYANLIMKYASNALVINFTNPLVLSTQVLCSKFPGIKAVGLCPEFLYAHEYYKRICEVIFEKKIEKGEFKFSALGINHFIWVNCLEFNGKDAINDVKDYFFKDSTSNILNNKEKIIKYIVEKYDCLPAARLEYFLEFLPYSEFLGNSEIIGDIFEKEVLIEARMKNCTKNQKYNIDVEDIEYFQKRVTYCYRKDICAICKPNSCWRAICKKIPKIIDIVHNHKNEEFLYNMCLKENFLDADHGRVKEFQVNISSNGFNIIENDRNKLPDVVSKLLDEQMSMVENIICGVKKKNIMMLKEVFCKDMMLEHLSKTAREDLFEALIKERCIR